MPSKQQQRRQKDRERRSNKRDSGDISSETDSSCPSDNDTVDSSLQTPSSILSESHSNDFVLPITPKNKGGRPPKRSRSRSSSVVSGENTHDRNPTPIPSGVCTPLSQVSLSDSTRKRCSSTFESNSPFPSETPKRTRSSRRNLEPPNVSEETPMEIVHPEPLVEKLCIVDEVGDAALIFSLPQYTPIHNIAAHYDLPEIPSENQLNANRLALFSQVTIPEIQEIINANRLGYGLRHNSAHAIDLYLCWLKELLGEIVPENLRCKVCVIRSQYFLNLPMAPEGREEEYQQSFPHVYGDPRESDYIIMSYGSIAHDNNGVYNPENCEGHFSSAVYIVATRQVLFFDSLESENEHVVQTSIASALFTCLPHDKRPTNFLIDEFIYCRGDRLNRQVDGFSCGFFSPLHVEIFLFYVRFQSLDTMRIPNLCIKRYIAKVLNIVQKLSQNIFPPYYGFNVEHFKIAIPDNSYVVQSRPYPVKVNLPREVIAMPPPPPPAIAMPPPLPPTSIAQRPVRAGRSLSPFPSSSIGRSSQNNMRARSHSPSHLIPNRTAAKAFTSKCHTALYHKFLYCGAIGLHYPFYYDLRGSKYPIALVIYTTEKDFGMVACEFCLAWLYPPEVKRCHKTGRHGSVLCCSYGKVQLVRKFQDLQRTPKLLKDLKMYSYKKFATTHKILHERSLNFFKNILLYNNETSFGSMSVNHSPGFAAWGVQKFNGLITHRIGGPAGQPGKLLRNGQVYAIDPVRARQTREAHNAILGNVLDMELTWLLHNMLIECHPLAKLYRQAGELMMELGNEALYPHVQLQILNTRTALQQGGQLGGIDRRSVELPNGDIVGYCWIEDGNEGPAGMDILVTGLQGNLEILSHYSPNMDPILFPMLLAYGQQMFHIGIPLVDPADPTLSVDFDPYPKFAGPEEILAIDDADDVGIDLEHLPDHLQPTKHRVNVSEPQFFRYMFSLRGANPRSPHWLWSKSGQLGQTYIIHCGNRIERKEFDYIKKHIQPNMRSTLPKAFIDYLQKKVLHPDDGSAPLGNTLGKVFIAPAYIKDSRRARASDFSDFATITNAFGTPDIFLTFTANPSWPEITDLLHDGQTWKDRPDLVVRVFEQKCNHLLSLLNDKQVLGPVAAFCGSFEHQNRSLPHLHLLIILQRENNNVFNVPNWTPMTLTPEEYIEKYISAEIPEIPDKSDPDYERKMRLRELVCELLLHRCSKDYCLDNPDAKCRFRYPQPLRETTSVPDHHYPLYRRRPKAPSPAMKAAFPELFGETVQKHYGGRLVEYDNSVVVPHNPFLLLIFEAHINVEYCRGDRAAEYLNKYVTKGNSLAFVKANRIGEDGLVDFDQFREIQLVNYRTAPESLRKNIYHFPISIKSHTVKRLVLHLPNQAPLVYDEEALEEEVERLQARVDKPQRSMLIAFFDLCKTDKKAAKYCYPEINRYYSYDTKSKEWVPRLHAPFNCLTRIWSSNPKKLELNALRCLLLHIPGGQVAKIWDQKISGQQSFVEAAEAFGLLESDAIWIDSLSAFTLERHSYRRVIDFFAILLITGIPRNPLEIVRRFSDRLFPPGNLPFDALLQQFLVILENRLRHHGVHPNEAGETACEQFSLPRPQNFVELTEDEAINAYYFGDLMNDDAVGGNRNSWQAYVERHLDSLNAGQRQFYDMVLFAIESLPKDEKGRRLFLLKGEGGTGKTFVENMLIAYCKWKKRHVNSTCSMALPAQLLMGGGQTVHSAFYCPNDVDKQTMPRLDRSTHKAAILRASDLIIIDEAPFLHQNVFDFVDKTMKFVMQGTPFAQEAFGGKIVLIVGDFKQTLPVEKGGMYEQFAASIKNHPLFPLFYQHKLTENKRLLPSEQKYRELCLAIGTGSNYEQLPSRNIVVPEEIRVNSTQELIDFVYGDDIVFQDPIANSEYFASRSILAPLNRTCDEINSHLLSRLPGHDVALISSHNIVGTSDDAYDCLATDLAKNHLEVIERRQPKGFPPHRLVLRVGAIIFITRNLSRSQTALCNGTRLQVVEINQNLLTCVRLLEPMKGQKVYVSKFRFSFRPSLDEAGAPFDRLQFPVRLAFAMTTNKSQGQTLGIVGLDSRIHQCFAHGQCNVSFTRVRAANTIRVLTKTHPDEGRIENVVCYDILDEDERPEGCELFFPQ